MAMPRGPSVADAALLMTAGSKPLTSDAKAIVMLPPGWGAGPVLAVVDVATTFTSDGCEFGVVLRTVVAVVDLRAAVPVDLAVVEVAPEAGAAVVLDPLVPPATGLVVASPAAAVGG